MADWEEVKKEIDWLKEEYKKDNDRLLKENKELKEILKLALYDIKQVSDEGCCYGCKHNKGVIQYGFGCQIFKRESNCYKWQYEEQALKLIDGETNES